MGHSKLDFSIPCTYLDSEKNSSLYQNSYPHSSFILLGLTFLHMFKIFGKYVDNMYFGQLKQRLNFFFYENNTNLTQGHFFSALSVCEFFFSTFFLRALFYHVRMLFSRFCLLIQSKKGKSAQVTYCPRSCQCHDQHGVECMNVNFQRGLLRTYLRNTFYASDVANYVAVEFMWVPNLSSHWI